MSPNSFAYWNQANQEMAKMFQGIAQKYVETMQECMTTSTQSMSQMALQTGSKSDVDTTDNRHLKTGLICFKNITNANHEVLSHILHIQINALDLDGLAVSFRKLTNSLNDAALREIEYKPAVAQHSDDEAGGEKSEIMSQLGSSTTAMINYKNLINSMTYRLAQQEAALGAAYLEGLVLYVEKLRNAKVIEDVVGAQTLMLHHIQSQFKESTMDSISTLTAFKAGVNVWTENVIDSTPVKL